MTNMVLCREFAVAVVSATNVENVRNFRRSKLYSKVRVGNIESKTNTDKDNETDPQWNSCFKFAIPVDYIHAANSALNLEIEICLDSILRSDQRVGYAKQNIHKLFVDGSYDMKQVLEATSLSLPLVTDSGIQKGEVGLVYCFSEEKYIKKLSFGKKLVNFGTSVAVSTAMFSIIGIHIPIPMHVFEAQEIVYLSGASTTMESIGEFIVEGVQSLVS